MGPSPVCIPRAAEPSLLGWRALPGFQSRCAVRSGLGQLWLRCSVSKDMRAPWKGQGDERGHHRLVVPSARQTREELARAVCRQPKWACGSPETPT